MSRTWGKLPVSFSPTPVGRTGCLSVDLSFIQCVGIPALGAEVGSRAVSQERCRRTCALAHPHPYSHLPAAGRPGSLRAAALRSRLAAAVETRLELPGLDFPPASGPEQRSVLAKCAGTLARLHPSSPHTRMHRIGGVLAHTSVRRRKGKPRKLFSPRIPSLGFQWVFFSRCSKTEESLLVCVWGRGTRHDQHPAALRCFLIRFLSTR